MAKNAKIEKDARWADVKAKGEAIVAADGVYIVRNNPSEVEAYVMSGDVAGEYPVYDGGPYHVILSKKSWENSDNVGGWCQGYLCSCQWGQFNSGEPGPRQVGRFCFEPDSMVLMADGTYKRICDISVGDMVESKSGPKRVANVFENDYDGDMVEVAYSGSCFPIRMTSDHNVLCNDNLDEWAKSHTSCSLSNKGNKGYRLLTDYSEWNGFVEAGDLSEGDLSLFASVSSSHGMKSIRFSDLFGERIVEEDGLAYWSIEHKGDSFHGGRVKTMRPIKNEIAFDSDFAFIAGWYLAEGSIEGHRNVDGVRANSIVRWSLNSDEREVAEKIISILEAWGCVGASVYDYSYRGSIAVKVSCQPLAELLLRFCGEYSNTKALSQEIMLAGVDFQKAFLDAYWDGDGCVKGMGKCIYTSSSVLARQISQIVQRVYGIDASVHSNMNCLGPQGRANGKVDGDTIYHIDFDCRYAQRRYAVDKWHTAHRVASVKRYHKSGKVYNIEVEDDHVYCVEGLMVHNCSHAYAALLVSNMRARGEFMNDRHASMECRHDDITKHPMYQPVQPFPARLAVYLDYDVKNPFHWYVPYTLYRCDAEWSGMLYEDALDFGFDTSAYRQVYNGRVYMDMSKGLRNVPPDLYDADETVAYAFAYGNISNGMEMDAPGIQVSDIVKIGDKLFYVEVGGFGDPIIENGVMMSSKNAVNTRFVPHWDMDYYAIDYEIYQTNGERGYDYRFESFDWAMEHGFSLKDYSLVYSGELRKPEGYYPDEEICEQLFTILNTNQPHDYRARSLSVSDIICLEGHYYYVDSIGFVEVDEETQGKFTCPPFSFFDYSEQEGFQDGEIIQSYNYIESPSGRYVMWCVQRSVNGPFNELWQWFVSVGSDMELSDNKFSTPEEAYEDMIAKRRVAGKTSAEVEHVHHSEEWDMDCDGAYCMPPYEQYWIELGDGNTLEIVEIPDFSWKDDVADFSTGYTVYFTREDKHQDAASAWTLFGVDGHAIESWRSLDMVKASDALDSFVSKYPEYYEELSAVKLSSKKSTSNYWDEVQIAHQIVSLELGDRDYSDADDLMADVWEVLDAEYGDVDDEFAEDVIDLVAADFGLFDYNDVYASNMIPSKSASNFDIFDWIYDAYDDPAWRRDTEVSDSKIRIWLDDISDFVEIDVKPGQRTNTKARAIYEKLLEYGIRPNNNWRRFEPYRSWKWESKEAMDSDRREYLEDLADEYGVDEDIVFMLADVLGPNEDYDGLITELEDLDFDMFASEKNAMLYGFLVSDDERNGRQEPADMRLDSENWVVEVIVGPYVVGELPMSRINDVEDVVDFAFDVLSDAGFSPVDDENLIDACMSIMDEIDYYNGEVSIWAKKSSSSVDKILSLELMDFEYIEGSNDSYRAVVYANGWDYATIWLSANGAYGDWSFIVNCPQLIGKDSFDSGVNGLGQFYYDSPQEALDGMKSYVRAVADGDLGKFGHCAPAKKAVGLDECVSRRSVSKQSAYVELVSFDEGWNGEEYVCENEAGRFVIRQTQDEWGPEWGTYWTLHIDWALGGQWNEDYFVSPQEAYTSLVNNFVDYKDTSGRNMMQVISSRKIASSKQATRTFTYAEMQELEDEVIDKPWLNNADRLKNPDILASF